MEPEADVPPVNVVVLAVAAFTFRPRLPVSDPLRTLNFPSCSVSVDAAVATPELDSTILPLVIVRALPAVVPLLVAAIWPLVCVITLPTFVCALLDWIDPSICVTLDAVVLPELTVLALPSVSVIFDATAPALAELDIEALPVVKSRRDAPAALEPPVSKDSVLLVMTN